MTINTPRLSAEPINQFLLEQFPQCPSRVDRVEDDGAVWLHQAIGPESLRPGNTVSGPTMMTLADTALYVAVLADRGLIPLAVTTSLNINFLRRPAANQDLIACCRLLKSGPSTGRG